MLFANYTSWLSERFGVEKSVEMIADAGFPAVDISMMKLPDPPFCEDWRELAKRLNTLAEKRGITYIQAHAPVGKWDYYIENVIPMLPDVIEFAGLVGIPNLVVHPIMRGYYYDDKDKMFAENIDFYKSIAPIAKKHGVKVVYNPAPARAVSREFLEGCCLITPNLSETAVLIGEEVTELPALAEKLQSAGISGRLAVSVRKRVVLFPIIYQISACEQAHPLLFPFDLWYTAMKCH